MAVCAIHQPNFLPNESFFRKMKQADKFIILDDAQYVYRDYHSRNFLLLSGKKKSIRVPTIKKLKDINRIFLNDKVIQERWRKNFLLTLEKNYKYSKGFDILYPKLKEIFQKDYEKLIDLNMKIIEFIRELLNIKNPLYFSSELKYPGKGKIKRDKKLIALTKAVGCSKYLSGLGGKDYIDRNLFRLNGIELEFVENLKTPESCKYSIINKLFEDPEWKL